MKRKFLSIKNFEIYQHYKDRLPPWIKLHVALLDDAAFLRLPDASKWHYIGLTLLASRHDNQIPLDASYITNRLGLTTEIDLRPQFLKEHVLAPGASKALASCKQVATDDGKPPYSEAEAEAYKTTETEKQVAVLEDQFFMTFWAKYPKKVGKDAARKAWKKIQPNAELCQTIITALDNQRHHDQWTKDQGKFIPNPSTWLNGKRWEDELTIYKPIPKSLVELL